MGALRYKSLSGSIISCLKGAKRPQAHTFLEFQRDNSKQLLIREVRECRDKEGTVKKQ